MAITIPSFDDLVQAILTEYSNLDPSPNTTTGSIVFIKASCLASALWGLYNYGKYVADQQFPDTSDTDHLNHWGVIYGIVRASGESDSAYASRIVKAIQTPGRGGNQLDYKTWAESQSWSIVNPESIAPASVNTGTGYLTVTQSWPTDHDTSFPVTVHFSSTITLPTGISPSTDYYVTYRNSTHITVSASRGGPTLVPSTQGSGVITLTPTANTYPVTASIITPQSTPTASPAGQAIVIYTPSDLSILTSIYIHGGLQTIANNIKAYIEQVRPVTANLTTVYPVSTYAVSITMTVNSGANLSLITSDVQNYIASFTAGQTLYVSNLIALAINDGAQYATVSLPASDVTPAYNQVITCASPYIHY